MLCPRLYTDDVEFVFGPIDGELFTDVGRDLALENDRSAIAAGAQVEFVITRIDGNVVEGVFTFTDDDSRALGGPLTILGDITVEDGRIARFLAELDEETLGRLTAFQEGSEAPSSMALPSAEEIGGLTALIAAEGAPELQAKLLELLAALFESAGPPPIRVWPRSSWRSSRRW